ncbi:N-acetyltransferase [Leptolyngbya sp. 15MV]|nr:N-acetyltransferase [Leptolyngbya sp. 15MV]
MTMTIRPEAPGDEPAIHALTEAAFREVKHSDGSEAAIVDRLRADGDLALSLVALNLDHAIVGHVAFSPVTISDGSEGWFGLGPCSVIPTRQRTGIGSELIKAGLAELESRAARGVVLLGSPAYYGRFGFEHDPRLVYPGPPAEYFQRLVLAGDAPSGTVTYAPAFG